MDDLISRQAAIDALDTLAESYADDTEDDYFTGCYSGVNRSIDAIKALPTAQPEREWSELDKQLIDTLLRKIYELQGTSLSMDGVVAKKYYVNELYKVLFGRGEKPKWMI